MEQENYMKIILLSNGNYRFKVKIAGIVSALESTFAPTQMYSDSSRVFIFMETFDNKGKYQNIKFSYDAATTILTVNLSKKKINPKEKRLADIVQTIFKLWQYTTTQYRQLSMKPFENNIFRLESIDAIGMEVSRVYPEYENKRVYFKYSEFQFNNNISHLDSNRYLYPNLAYSFNKGDYYKNPRLSFLEENFKLNQYLEYKGLEKYFTIGLTLYSLHFFPKIIEDQMMKDKFNKILKGQYVHDPRLTEVQLKRKEFQRRVASYVTLTSINRMMTNYSISYDIENQFKQQYTLTVSASQDKQDPETIKVTIRSSYYDESMYRYLEHKLTNYSRQVYFKMDSNKKEIMIGFVYKERLFLEMILLYLEISWFKALDRNIKSTKTEQLRDGTLIKRMFSVENVGNHNYELILAPFYMRFTINENQIYELDNIRMDFSKDKLEAIRLESQALKTPIQNAFSGSERTNQQTKSGIKPLFHIYPGLREYINWYINTFNLKDISEILKLCQYCSFSQRHQNFSTLINQIILGANEENKKPDTYIKISMNIKQNSEFSVSVRKLDNTGSNIKYSKISFQPAKDSKCKLMTHEKEREEVLEIQRAYRPDELF